MSDNPFGEAMEEQDSEQEPETSEDSFELEEFYDGMATGPKEKTIGFSATEEMHAFFHELHSDDEVEIDIHQSLRDHVEKLAHRHEDVFERAMRKMEIDREY